MVEFIDNKYKKIYFNLVSKRKQFPLDKSQAYCESHHIIPKSLGGSNKKENIVNFTAREHFIAHKLLTKIVTGGSLTKMWWALHRLSFSNKNIKLNSHNYEKLRKDWSSFLTENHPSKTNPNWTSIMSEAGYKQWKDNDERRKSVGDNFKKSHEQRKQNDPNYYKLQKDNSKLGSKSIKRLWSENGNWAEEQRKLMSGRVSGENNPMYGKKHSDETKKLLSESSSRRRWISNETKTIYIDIDLIEQYIEKGYIMGRKKIDSNGKEESVC